MASFSLHPPVNSGYILLTDTPRHSDVPHPTHPGSCTSSSEKSDPKSQRTVPTGGILKLPPVIHHTIAGYLPSSSIYAMVLFLSCPKIPHVCTSNLHVYASKASKLGSCGKMLMQTLALPEFSPQAFRALLDVCPKRELMNQRDDAHWALSTAEERNALATRYMMNNTRWLSGFCGKFSTLELARLYPRDAPETFSNPINMAAAVGDVVVLQMLLDKLGGPAAWTDCPTFGFTQPSRRTYERAREHEYGGFYCSERSASRQLGIIGPLHWAAVYGQHETFAVLIAWFQKNGPEKLLGIFSCNDARSLLYCAVYRLYHPESGRRIGGTIKIINVVAGLLPDDIRYESRSPLYLALMSENPPVGVEMIQALLAVPGGLAAYSDRGKFCKEIRIRPAVFNTLLDARLSVVTTLLTDLTKRIMLYRHVWEDCINLDAALQRASRSVKDVIVHHVLRNVESFSTSWHAETNPLITFKINGCLFDHGPMQNFDLTVQQYLIRHCQLDRPGLAVVMSWLVKEMGLDCASFVPSKEYKRRLKYAGPTTTVRELAIQSAYEPLYSIVLDIPHVPLPEAVPQAARAIFAKHHSLQEHAEYVAKFLQYPTDITDVFQWAVTTATEHHVIPVEWRFPSVDLFIQHLRVWEAMKWIGDNRENGVEEMREAGYQLEEWHRRAAVKEHILENLNKCIVDICEWAESL